MNRAIHRGFFVCFLVLAASVTSVEVRAEVALGTAFTYQGQLRKDGNPLDGTCDLQFSLWDAATVGGQIGSTQTILGQTVTNGLFTVQLDLGQDAFNGNARWLEIGVRSPAGSGSYTLLTPRQELTPAPYALYAASAGSADSPWKLNGTHIYYNEGNVGIGTDTPHHELDVNGTTKTTDMITKGPYVDVRAYNSFADAIAAIGSESKSVLIANEQNVTADKTVPSNVTLRFLQGGSLNISNGVTVTINGHIEAGLYQIFEGSGTVSLGSGSVREVHPEWWGENTTPGTTDMTEEIQAAVDSLTAGIVFLQAETYGTGKITMASNTSLIGSGWKTVLDAGANRAILIAAGANIDSQILISGVSNVQVKNLKLDGQSNNGALGNAYSAGIEISGGSSHVLIDTVYMYDEYYFGLHVRTSASDIDIDHLIVELGCQSNAILVGVLAAETGNVRNINLSNIIVKNMLGDGIGTWSAGTGETENVNYTNIIIRNIGTLEVGTRQAFWGSTDAEAVTLNSFTIDGNSSGGHGIHIEGVESWQISNGIIRDINPGYAINITGDMKRSNLTNITVKDTPVRGLLVWEAANDNNFSNITIDGSGSGALIGGVRNSFVNCKFLDDTFAGNGSAVEIRYDAEDLVFANNQIHATGAGTTGAGIEFAAIVSATVKNNRVTGTIAIPIRGNTNKVTAETVSIRLRESVAAATDYELPILMLPLTQNYYIVSAFLTFKEDITQNNTDYNTYTIKRRNSAGGSVVSVTTPVTTKLTGGSDFNAFSPIELSVANHNYANVPGGYGISLAKTVAGAGQAEADGLLTINYVTY